MMILSPAFFSVSILSRTLNIQIWDFLAYQSPKFSRCCFCFTFGEFSYVYLSSIDFIF